jgi:hypothetical protein
MTVVRVLFHKITDERHGLEIVRDDGRRERVECETRSCLLHDFLHYAVEAEAGLDEGFWGRLAAGKTLADMNDRTGVALGTDAPALGAVEQIVGALSGVTKGRSAGELIAGMRRYADARGAATPGWLTEPLLEAVQERMRRLTGHWRATPYGQTMQLDWPSAPE